MNFFFFFYISAIPFNCVKHPEFKKLCKVIRRYGIGYQNLKQELEHTHNLLKDHRTKWKRTGCTIMFNGWMDKKRHSICNLLVNSPEGTVLLHLMDTSDIFKTFEKVLKMLDEVMEMVREENVVQVITDNAANYKVARKKLMEKRKHLYWTTCATHCIDLMLKDFEKKVKLYQEIIAKGRKITTYIYGRTLLISILRNFTIRKDLIRLLVTRFSTAI